MKQYLKLLGDILQHGLEHRPTDERTGTGTISLFGGPEHQMSFNLQEGFPLVTTKKVPFRWIAEELIWFLSGSTNERDLRAKGVDIWKEWATAEQCARFGREEGDLGPVYGFLWRHFGGDYDLIKNGSGVEKMQARGGRDWGVDQVARLMKDLQGPEKYSRRHIITGWDARECDNVALPPCHTLVQFKVERWPIIGDTLSCSLYMRSCDAFLGLPFNIASYALLTHMIARCCGFNVGRLIHSFGDVHIYMNHLAQVNTQLTRRPLALPRLEIKPLDVSGLEGLLALRYEDMALWNYAYHNSIPAPVAV